MYATREDTVVSCSAAQWICAADPLCSTALEYYNRFCQAMFRGKKCTSRCMNSISILRRQPRASKLESCYCDGTENFDCPKIKSNMDQLCFRDPLIGKKHALKKYDQFAQNISCFWGSTGSNITPVVHFHDIFVAKIMKKLICYYC